MRWRVADVPTNLYGLDSASEVFRFLILILALGFFVHLAAKVVIDRSTIAEALVAVMLGILLGVLAFRLIRVEALGVILGLVIFSVVTAMVYRVKPLKGAAIGAMAWMMWNVVSFLFEWVLDKTN